jgi:hypothetical protein
MKVREEPIMAVRAFKVLLDSSTDFVEETVVATEGGAPTGIKKHKTKAMKDDYKIKMKDPSRYPDTHMADGDHPTIVMRRGQNDCISFFNAEEFVLFTQRDPEIDEDFSAPDSPFIDGGGNPLTYKVSDDQGPAHVPGTERYIAGPYTVANNANNQRFYKFAVVTKSGKILDPDLVMEP